MVAAVLFGLGPAGSGMDNVIASAISEDVRDIRRLRMSESPLALYSRGDMFKRTSVGGMVSPCFGQICKVHY